MIKSILRYFGVGLPNHGYLHHIPQRQLHRYYRHDFSCRACRAPVLLLYVRVGVLPSEIDYVTCCFCHKNTIIY